MNAEESVEISALSIDEAILIGLTRLDSYTRRSRYYNSG